jgi:hypothetical protein
MRFIVILLLPLILLSFIIPAYAGSGCGSNWLGNDAVGNDPDFSVSAHQLGSLVKPSPDLSVPTNSKTSKPRVAPDERGSTKVATSGPNMSMPDPNPKPLVAADNSNYTIDQNTSIDSGQYQEQPEVKLLDVNGKWLVKFDDGTDKSMDLNLWSSSESGIMGYGSLNDGSSKKSVTASGSVNEKELVLTAKTSVPEYSNQKDLKYDLNLIMLNDKLSGTFVLNSDGQSLAKGNVTAIRR